MFIHLDTSDTPYRIQQYEPGCVVINQTQYKTNVMIRGKQLLQNWFAKPLSELHYDDLNIFDADLPQTIIIGTGPQFHILPERVIEPFLARHVGVEFMDSRSACFTYTALASEGRDVAVFLVL